MRKLMSGVALAAVLGTIPVLADAQRQAATGARHEWGVDVTAGYMKPDGSDGGIFIITPFDVRLGFVSRSNMMWEGRLGFDFSTVGGETRYEIRPGMNVLFANSPGGHRRGMYFTGGAGLLLADNGAESGTAFAINAGVGWRKPQRSAALRYEVGFQWSSESADLGLPSTIVIGGRIGLSLWN
jgi:opacity protein-like surface antigen